MNKSDDSASDATRCRSPVITDIGRGHRDALSLCLCVSVYSTLKHFADEDTKNTPSIFSSIKNVRKLHALILHSARQSFAAHNLIWLAFHISEPRLLNLDTTHYRKIRPNHLKYFSVSSASLRDIYFQYTLSLNNCTLTSVPDKQSKTMNDVKVEQQIHWQTHTLLTYLFSYS